MLPPMFPTSPEEAVVRIALGIVGYLFRVLFGRAVAYWRARRRPAPSAVPVARTHRSRTVCRVYRRRY